MSKYKEFAWLRDIQNPRELFFALYGQAISYYMIVSDFVTDFYGGVIYLPNVNILKLKAERNWNSWF